MNQPSFGVLKPPPQYDGDYLETLHAWGELPEVVSLTNLSRLLGVLCKQNQGALLKILSGAVRAQDVEFFGLSHHGGWRSGMLRVLLPLSSKPRLRPETSTREASMTADFYLEGPLHFEAMGMRPSDAVALLVKRGRKVPDVLKSFLPEDAIQASEVGKPTPERRLMTQALVVETLKGCYSGINLDKAMRTPRKEGREGLLAARVERGRWDLDAVLAWLKSKGYYRHEIDTEGTHPSQAATPFSGLGQRRK